jgi:AcrR family transcriptional regulator
MPAVAKTSDEEILAAARRIVDKHGADALSMQALGDEVGVRAPSLYKRFPHRDAILDGVLAGVLVELTSALRRAQRGRSTERDLVRLAGTYRAFAHRRPHLYALLFAHRPTGPAITAAREAAVAPLFSTLRTWLPDAQVLDAARSLVAFLHGFITMELDGAFRLGGSVDRAYRFGVRAWISAIRTAAKRDTIER